VDAVDEAEIDDVDAELGVDDVLHRLGDVVDADVAVAAAGGLGTSGRSPWSSPWSLSPPRVGPWRPSRPSTTAVRTSRGGELGDAGERDAVLQDVLVGLDRPLPCIRVRNSSWIAIASSTACRSRGRSAPTPTPARSSSRRRRTTRPRRPVATVDAQRHLVTAGRVDVVHLGLEGSRRPLWWGFL
jgi:hypothetical protein